MKGYRSTSLQEALDRLAKEKMTIFAGGTDLMIRRRAWQGADRPFKKPVLFIGDLQELRNMEVSDQEIYLGACLTQEEVFRSPLMAAYLRHVFGKMATPSIRMMATLGGNIVNAASVADSLPLWVALDAKVHIARADGRMIVPIDHFLMGKYKTMLREDELVIGISFTPQDYPFWRYIKLGQRKSSILSKVSVLLLGDHEMKQVRIVVGAVNDTPIRIPKAEELFFQDLNIQNIQKIYKGAMSGQSDKRSTKSYREETATDFIGKFLEEFREDVKHAD